MDYELVKNEFIKLKKDELSYIDSIAKISSSKILSEYEKLEIYRNLKKYELKLNESLKMLFKKMREEKILEKIDFEDVIIEFDLNKNFLSFVKFNSNRHKKYVLESLKIDSETYKFKLTLSELLYNQKRQKRKAAEQLGQFLCRVPVGEIR